MDIDSGEQQIGPLESALKEQDRGLAEEERAEPITVRDVIYMIMNPHFQEPGDMTYLEMIRDLKLAWPEMTLEYFFFIALTPYYRSCRNNDIGLDPLEIDLDTHHLLYRLSDYIPEEERKKMAMSPSMYKVEELEYYFPEGKPMFEGSDEIPPSIIKEDEDGEKSAWYSLEDWRHDWRTYQVPVPEFTKKLRDGLAGMIEDFSAGEEKSARDDDTTFEAK